ncbi:MAG: Flp family type IVb pilin [Chloroflexota bacterium]
MGEITDGGRPEGAAAEASRDTGRRAPARGELGQGLVEYALIIFLVAIVVIAILLLLGPQIGAVFSSLYATI